MRRHWTLAEALAYGRGVERPFLCPVHGDSRPSASVNVAKKKWYCYTCGARGGLTGEHALVEPDYEALRCWFDEKMAAVKTYPETWLARWDAGGVHPYWLRRTGEEAARHFRLGYDPDWDAVTYPLRNDAGEVLGVVRRPLSDDGARYRYPTGVDIGRLLFNYTPEHRKYVVLVEGALDAVALWNVGVHAMAIYGAHMSAEQVALIDRIDPMFVYTCFDNDDAGFNAHREVHSLFRHRFVHRLTWPRSWGKDIDELSIERRKRVVSVLAQTDQRSIDSTVCRSSESASTKPRLRILSSPTT